MTKSKITKLLGVAILTLAATVGIASSAPEAQAWGPERQTFTMANPADYPTFNSITDNPTIQDERDFVRIGELHSANDTNPSPTTLSNTAEIIPGHQYLVYIYVHNNASATYNDKAHNNAGVALQTRLSTAFSTVVTPSNPGTVSATVTASNSTPTSVWDEASMTTTYDKVLLSYLTGSAKIFNDWGLNGSVMPNTLFTETGSLLGLNALNGVIPGCEEYHVIVSYVLEAKELSGTIEKTVSKDGTNFAKNIQTNPGDEVTFKLTIKNAGDVALTNATIKDTLPEGLTLMPDTTKLMANDSGTWDTLSDNIIGTGFNLGTIGTGNTVVITYKAIVKGDYDCTGTDLTNSAILTYDSEVSTGDTSSDFAIVNAKKADCAPVVETCETNPNLDGCNLDTPTELPNTGPVEIVMAIVIVLGILGGGFYFFRTQRTLNRVKKGVSGKTPETPDQGTEAKIPESKPEETPSDKPAEPTSSQKS